MTKKIGAFLLVLAIAFSVQAQSAQALSFVAQPCIGLSASLRYGMRDGSTNGEVRALQTFLTQKGYLSAGATGYFGPLTRAAVIAFQQSVGLGADGIVGALTRAKLACMGTVGEPTITSLSPTSGAVGTEVTIYGTEFTPESQVRFGDGAIGGVTYESATKITFTIPEYMGKYCPVGQACIMIAQKVEAGTYAVSVITKKGTSNSISFTIPGAPTSNTVSISGIDAPTSLPMGTTGTWTIHATCLTCAGGSLSYSVVWGNEEVYASGASSIAMPKPTTVQTNATFTHTYTRAGSYTPRFTVSAGGQESSASASVTITPWY